MYGPEATLSICFCIVFLCISPAFAQTGAIYEDEIERERKRIFTKDGRIRGPPREPVTVNEPNLFNKWDGIDRQLYKPRASFHADVVASRRNIDYWVRGDGVGVGSFSSLVDFYFGLPPPPQPPPLVTTTTTTIPPNLLPFYDPLLQFIRAGPGGSAIDVTHLQQLTPSLLDLAPLLVPGVNFSQLVYTPQGQAFIAAARQVLFPLGLWNVHTLNNWVYYIQPQQSYLVNVLQTLRSQITTATPTTSRTTSTTPVPGINQFEVISKLIELWQSGDKLKIASDFPGLAHSIIEYAGFDEPTGVIYARDDKISLWPYNVGITTERYVGNRREIHVLNSDGYFVNKWSTGADRWWQGPLDISMVRLPFEVDGTHVDILDVVASNRYALYKRAAGGDIRLLDRASTFTTSLINVDVALFEDKWLHLRPYVGTTPHSSIGGIMLKAEYDADILKGHISGGVGWESSLFADLELFSGYFETENILKTPFLAYSDPKTRAGVRLWASLTLMASTLSQRGERWTFQAEARFIPEIHVQFVSERFSLRLTGGVTAAIVPGGKADLAHPERTLGFHPIRRHGEAVLRVDAGDGLLLEFGTVLESSSLVFKSRSTVGLSHVGQFTLMTLVETEKYRGSSFTDVRVGGKVAYKWMHISALKSVKDDDYRIEAGIDVAPF